MSILSNERERRARIGITGFDWVNDTTPHKMVLRNEKDLKAEEEERNNKKFAEIAARDAATAEKYGGPQAWQKIYDGSPDEHRRLLQTIKANPQLAVCRAQAAVTAELNREMEAEEKRQEALCDRTDELLRRLNKATQKRQPPNLKHPLYKIVKAERLLERRLNPKPKGEPDESWRKELTASRHWQDALRRSKMTPAQLLAEDTAIEIAVNTETVGSVAQALAAQEKWDALEVSGEVEQLDFSGFLWPMEKDQ